MLNKICLQAFAVAVLGMDGAMVHDGVGRHQYYLSLTPALLKQLSNAVMWTYISEPILILSTLWTKLSISIFLLRIFGTKMLWRWGLYFIMAFAAATSISSAAIVLAQCQPVQKLWDPLISGSCWSPDIQLKIGDYNGGWLITSTNITADADRNTSCGCSHRLGPCNFTHRLHVESSDEQKV